MSSTKTVFLIGFITAYNILHLNLSAAQDGTVKSVHHSYRAFHRFGQAKIANGGLVLGSSQFSLLPQLPYKMVLDSKVVKIESKIIISLC